MANGKDLSIFPLDPGLAEAFKTITDETKLAIISMQMMTQSHQASNDVVSNND